MTKGEKETRAESEGGGTLAAAEAIAGTRSTQTIATSQCSSACAGRNAVACRFGGRGESCGGAATHTRRFQVFGAFAHLLRSFWYRYPVQFCVALKLQVLGLSLVLKWFHFCSQVVSAFRKHHPLSHRCCRRCCLLLAAAACCSCSWCKALFEKRK